MDCRLISVVRKPGHIFLVHPGPTSYLNSVPSHNEERRAGLSLPFVSLMGEELLHSASFLSPCPPQFSMHGTYVSPSLSSCQTAPTLASLSRFYLQTYRGREATVVIARGCETKETFPIALDSPASRPPAPVPLHLPNPLVMGMSRMTSAVWRVGAWQLAVEH